MALDAKIEAQRGDAVWACRLPAVCDSSGSVGIDGERESPKPTGGDTASCRRRLQEWPFRADGSIREEGCKGRREREEQLEQAHEGVTFVRLCNLSRLSRHSVCLLPLFLFFKLMSYSSFPFLCTFATSCCLICLSFRRSSLSSSSLLLPPSFPLSSLLFSLCPTSNLTSPHHINNTPCSA